MTLITRRAFGKTIAALLGASLMTSRALAFYHDSDQVVTIKGFKFSPANIRIKAGETVVFTNEDDAPHTATADNGAFDTGRLDKGESKSVEFSEAGIFEYFCDLHPSMKARITVQS